MIALKGMKLASDICKALGIDTEKTCITKVVIECTLDNVATFYIKGIVSKQADEFSIPGIITVIAVESVTVSDDCTLSFVPSKE
jgi:hypothetical protein